MKNIKNKKIIFIFLIFIIILIGGYYLLQYLKNNEQLIYNNEYIPEKEITEEQLRQTIVSLYFENTETKKLMPEARLIDAKLLINNPYLELVSMLIEGSKNDKLEKLIPEGTKINNIILEKDIIILDFSKEFIENAPEDKLKQNNIIYSIVNTLTELKEVNYIKILINGEENKGFNNGIQFTENFNRI